jgi:hypothetical protein
MAHIEIALGERQRGNGTESVATVVGAEAAAPAKPARRAPAKKAAGKKSGGAKKASAKKGSKK